MHKHPSPRRCTVYAGCGEPCAQSVDLESVPEQPRRMPTIADTIALRHIMTSDVVCARPELEVPAVVSLMAQHHVGCVPIVDDMRRPIGVVTKYDIVEHLDALLRSVGNGSPMPADLAPRTADEVMMPLALTLVEHASVATAAELMVAEDVHHVIVVDDRGRLVGVVSTKDITNWLVENDT